MRKWLIIICLLLTASSSFAQSWTQGQYTEFKGVIADSLLRLPRRDTIALGGNKDSVGQLLYRPLDSTVYVKTPTGWKSVGKGGSQPGYVYREDAHYIVDRGLYGDPVDGDSVLIDTTLAEWTYEVQRESVNLIRGVDYQYIPGGGFKLNPSISPVWYSGERIQVRFYPNVPVTPAVANSLKVVYYAQVPTDTITIQGYTQVFSYIKLPELKNKRIMQVIWGTEAAVPYEQVSDMCSDPATCYSGMYVYRPADGAIITAMGNYFPTDYTVRWAIYYQDLPGLSEPTNAISGKVISNSYSVSPEDSRLIISAASSPDPLDITLPAAASSSGRILYLFLKNANGRTIKVDGSIITSSKTYVCDGGTWSTD